MSEPFIAEIKIFAGNFAIRNYAFCNGQLLPISQNTALFSLVGTIYGGDGRTTFGLPELRGRTPIHSGGSSAGPGLSPRALGSRGGQETVTLTESEMPRHSHNASLFAETRNANSSSAEGNMLAARDNGYRSPAPSADVALSEGAIAVGDTGGGLAHENMPPFLAINYIIALTGIYPSRS